MRSEAEIGSRVGLLYAVNTAGAIAGTLSAAFWLMPELGLRRTVWGERRSTVSSSPWPPCWHAARGPAHSGEAAPGGIAHRCRHRLDPSRDRPLGGGLLRLRGALDAAPGAPARRKPRRLRQHARELPLGHRAGERLRGSPGDPPGARRGGLRSGPARDRRHRLYGLRPRRSAAGALSLARRRTRGSSGQCCARGCDAAADHALHRGHLPLRGSPARAVSGAGRRSHGEGLRLEHHGRDRRRPGGGLPAAARPRIRGDRERRRRDESRARRAHGARVATAPKAARGGGRRGRPGADRAAGARALGPVAGVSAGGGHAAHGDRLRRRRALQHGAPVRPRGCVSSLLQWAPRGGDRAGRKAAAARADALAGPAAPPAASRGERRARRRTGRRHPARVDTAQHRVDRRDRARAGGIGGQPLCVRQARHRPAGRPPRPGPHRRRARPAPAHGKALRRDPLPALPSLDRGRLPSLYAGVLRRWCAPT